MSAELLARIQFAVTAGFHFIFPPLTIGLSWIICWILWRYHRTGDEFYRRTARFWIDLFVISFVVGVASGIVLEFQFGTNWAEYSRFVGDIFGSPLAAEGILAFFLESTFIGVVIFGWNRVSRRVLWFSSLMVAIGSTLSAFWIIVANSWQQTPAGYRVVEAGRAELANFWEAAFNPSTIPRYLHTVDACLMTGAFFVLGVSAWYLLKKRERRLAQYSMRIALIVGLISSVAQLTIGHHHARQVAETQPEKFAAVEMIFDTQTRAPALVFGIIDVENEKVHAEVRIPGLLSYLAFGDFDAEVKGLHAFPREDWPPIPLTYYTFHLMVYIGSFLILLPVLGLLLLWRKALYENRLFHFAAVASIPLPFLANELGWISTEVGRQPWAVYRLLRTSDSLSKNVPPGQVLFSLIMFTLIYVLLFSVWVVLLKRRIQRGPEAPGDPARKEAPA